MSSILPFIVAGIAFGSIYGLAATGLVLTYKTSGIFNFGHGALATTAAYVFYWMHYDHGWDWKLSTVVSVLVVGPLLGLAMERIARVLSNQRTAWKVVGTVGLILLVQGLGSIKYGTDTRAAQPTYLPNGREFFRFAGVNITYAQVTVTVIGLIVVAALYALFRFTRLGVAMRAVVDDPDLLDLQGISPTRVRRISWIIGATLAALSGVLILPFLNLNAIILTFLVVQTFGAAAIGIFSSIPLAFAGGLIVGIGESVLTKYEISYPSIVGLSKGLPFIILIVVMLATPRQKLAPPSAAEVRPALEWRGPTTTATRRWRGRLWVAGIASIRRDLQTQPVLDQCHGDGVVDALSRPAGSHGGHRLAVHRGIRRHRRHGVLATARRRRLAVARGDPGGGPDRGAGGGARRHPVHPSFRVVPGARHARTRIADRTCLLPPLVHVHRVGRRPQGAPPRLGREQPRLLLARAGVCTRRRGGDRGHQPGAARANSGRNGRLTACGLHARFEHQRHRVIVFCIGAYIAAIAGALQAGATQQIAAESIYYSSFNSITMVAILALAPFRVPWYAVFAGVTQVIPGYIHGTNTPHVLTVIFGFFAIVIALQGGPHGMPPKLRQYFEARFGASNRAKQASADKPGSKQAANLRRSAPAVSGGGTAGLEVGELTVRFGGLVAVDGISLSAPMGRITGLIGPNGAGKTTTFNSCSGLNRPTHGGVRLHGADVSNVSPGGRARKGLGRSFQIMELCESLTVADNVALGRESSQAGARVLSQMFAPRSDILVRDMATAEAMALCGISDLAEQQAGALSTGQRRLVELARCLAGPFDILLLDEPSSGLDHDETARFGEILRTVVADRNCGILLVEHDMTLVMDVCEYIYVLDFGRMIFEGTPAEVAASRDVQAAYLGSETEHLAELEAEHDRHEHEQVPS